MSRIGKEPIPIPGGVQVAVEDGIFLAEGPKGKVSQALLPEVSVAVDEGAVRVSRTGESRGHRARHGLMRALLANAVTGVADGWSKELEIRGVGYKAEAREREIHMALGYSHPVVYPVPEGIDFEVDAKANRIKISGADRQLVGQVAAEIRGLRKPEPYKGKGIKYVDEVVRRKVGKAGAGS
ncbi:MAG: 50S ribosomal protein L6 [Acidobacteriota bacterium]|nr:50S ribosomal protein L6 [Acidobacteriota bacterium]